MNLGALPDDPPERLLAYQRAKRSDEEWWEVQRIKFKINLGEELTDREERYLAHSRYGTASRCGY